MIVGNYRVSSGNPNADDIARVVLTNGTTLTYTRGAGSTGALDFVTYVVEFTDASKVQHGTISLGNGVTSNTATINASPISLSGVIAPTHANSHGSTSYSTDDNFGYMMMNYFINNSTTVTAMRGMGTGSTAVAPYQVVTFGTSMFWDVSTSSGFQAGNGTWGTDDYWTADGLTLEAWPGALFDAKFTGDDENYTVTVTGTQSADNLSFTSSGYTLSGGTLNVGNSSGISVSPAKTAAISSVISGSNGLSLSGGGTLLLTGSNTYTGVTSIDAGILSVAALANGGSNCGIGASGNSAFNLVLNGGAFQYTGGSTSCDRLFTVTLDDGEIDASGSGALNFSNTGSAGLAGSGNRELMLTGSNTGDNILAALIGDNGGTTSLNKNGTGKWVLTNNNTATGAVLISNGTLQLGNGGSSGTVAGVITNNGTLVFNRSDNYVYSGAISGTGTLNQTGSGALILTGSNTCSGGTIVSNGTLQIGNSGASGSITGNTVNNSSLIFNRSDSYTYTRTISGSGSVTQSGNGTLTLTGINSYTGATVAGNGILSISTLADGGSNSQIGAALAASANLVINGGTLKYTGPQVNCNRLFTVGNGGAVIDASGSGVLNLNGSGSLSISGTGTRTLTLSGANISDNSLNAGIADDASSNATSVVKTGSGKWVLSGSNSYSGTTTVSSGTLVLNGQISAASNVIVNSGAKITGTGTASGTVNIASGAYIEPGNEGVGTLTTGTLILNSGSVVNFQLGTSRDSIKTVNLTLDGILNVTALSGFGTGNYCLFKYSGSFNDNELEIGSMPGDYGYSIDVSGGMVNLVVKRTKLNPLTVVQAASRCSVYTQDWTAIFDNGAGGGISVLTDSSNGKSHGQGNQIGDTQNLFYLYYNGAGSKANGTWSVVASNSVYASIRQSGSLSGLPYTTDYTIHGSGKMFIKSTLLNNTASEVSGKTVRCVAERRASAGDMSVTLGHTSADHAPYVLLSCDSSRQNDILLCIKDLWSTSDGAPNSASGFYNSSADGYAGYECNNFSLEAGQKQSWEFMLDFGHSYWNDSSGVGMNSDDYRYPDSLEFLTGTPLLEKATENGLAGHWKLDDGVGDTARDNSGYNHHASTNASWTTGRWSGGILFNGSKTVNCRDLADFDGTVKFTVMAWVKTTSLSATTIIAGKVNGANGWKLAGNNQGHLTLYLNGAGLAGVKDIASNTWRHVAASFSSGTVDTVMLYVDGRLDSTASGNFSANANDAAMLLGEGLTGTLDDVRFYKSVLTGNDIKSIYQLGYSSSEGFYRLRANNDNSINLFIDGGVLNRHFPVFQISNYWASSKPASGCVVLGSKSLAEGNDYYAVLDDSTNTLTLALNETIQSDAVNLYIDNDFAQGYQMAGETKRMVWGTDNNGSYDYFWVKNFPEDNFGGTTANQFYLNWKMSTAGNSKDGEIWHFASSVTNPNTPADTVSTTNLIPGYDNSYDSWGYTSLNIDGHYPKTSNTVSNAFSYTVEESSAVRIVLRVNERVASETTSFKIVTRWTIYPTGQIFRYDSLYSFSNTPNRAYIGAFMDNQAFSTVYSNKREKRAGLIYSQSYPDFGYAWLGMKNTSGFQSQPFDSDTIMPEQSAFRAGMDFGDLSLPVAWNSNSIQTAVYLDVQQSNMSNNFIDSVGNSEQYIGLAGGDALDVNIGELELTTNGDLNGDGFNEREGAYVVKADNNVVNFKLPARNDTCRFYPAFRITNYYASGKPQYVILLHFG